MAQNYENWRMYICHDGEPSELEKEEIRHIGNEKVDYSWLPERSDDMGSTPRNYCISMSQRYEHDLISYLDDDNEWLPNHLSSLVPLFEEHPEIVFAFSSSALYSKRDGRFLHNRVDMVADVNHIDSSEIMHRPSPLRWRKSGYANDWDLIKRMLDEGAQYAKCPEITVKYYSRWE
jgi:hypothetical protein